MPDRLDARGPLAARRSNSLNASISAAPHNLSGPNSRVFPQDRHQARAHELSQVSKRPRRWLRFPNPLLPSLLSRHRKISWAEVMPALENTRKFRVQSIEPPGIFVTPS